MSGKLLLCSGKHRPEGFITLDADPRCEPDIVARIPGEPVDSFRTNLSEIYLIHGIEHFHISEAKVLVRQIWKALEPGGFAVFEQPNLEAIARFILGLEMPPADLPMDRATIFAIYGEPFHPSGLMQHYWGYTPESLTQLLVESGFQRERIKVGEARSHWPCRDFRIEATK